MFFFVVFVPLLTVSFVFSGGHMWEVMSSDGGSLQNCGLVVHNTAQRGAWVPYLSIWGVGVRWGARGRRYAMRRVVGRINTFLFVKRHTWV